DFWKMVQNFCDAYDGKVFGVDDSVAASGAHPASTHPKKLDRGIDPMQSFNELGAIHFTGSLAGGDQDSHAAIVRQSLFLIARSERFLTRCIAMDAMGP